MPMMAVNQAGWVLHTSTHHKLNVALHGFGGMGRVILRLFFSFLLHTSLKHITPPNIRNWRVKVSVENTELHSCTDSLSSLSNDNYPLIIDNRLSPST